MLSTGDMGSELLRLLAASRCRQTRACPQPAKSAGLTFIAGDLAKPESFTPAFQVAKKLFLLTGYDADMSELQRNAIAAARAAGVTHGVNVSAFASSRVPIGRWHRQVEK